jgi:hypothetical protein
LYFLCSVIVLRKEGPEEAQVTRVRASDRAGGRLFGALDLFTNAAQHHNRQGNVAETVPWRVLVARSSFMDSATVPVVDVAPANEPDLADVGKSARTKPRTNFAGGELHRAEMFWVTHQPWLEELGYTIRPRFRPGWKASWLQPGVKTTWWRAEDAQILPVRHIIIAYCFIVLINVLIRVCIFLMRSASQTSGMLS